MKVILAEKKRKIISFIIDAIKVMNNLVPQ